MPPALRKPKQTMDPNDPSVASLAQATLAAQQRSAGAASSAALAMAKHGPKPPRGVGAKHGPKPRSGIGETVPVPSCILQFETAKHCKIGLAALTASKRQVPRWTVEAVDAVRLKLAYAEPKTLHTFRRCVVDAYLKTVSCEILAPGAAGAAAGAPDTGPATAGPAADTAVATTAVATTAAAAAAETEVLDSIWHALQAPDRTPASGGPSAAVLMARALMLLEPSTNTLAKSAE